MLAVEKVHFHLRHLTIKGDKMSPISVSTAVSVAAKTLKTMSGTTTVSWTCVTNSMAL